MELTPDQYDDLLDYLNNRMHSERKQAFEALLQQDEDLREELEFEKMWHKGVREMNQQDQIKAQVQAMHQQLVAEGKLTFPSRTEKALWRVEHHLKTYPWRYAAAAMLLLTLGVAFYWNPTAPTHTEIARQPVAPYDSTADTAISPAPPVAQKPTAVSPGTSDNGQATEPVYGASNTMEALFKEYYQPYSPSVAVPDAIGPAAEKYRQNNWQAAADALAQLDTNALSPLAKANYYLYKGLTSLANEDLESAMTAFEKALQPPGEVADAARWYLGLTYLQKGYQTEATALFKQLSQQKASPYHHKATQLHQKLRP